MLTDVIHDFTELHLDTSVKGVLLDFDNTFYRYEPCHKVALQTVATDVAMPLAEFDTAYHTARTTVKKRLHGQAASHSRLLYFYTMLSNLGTADSLSTSLRLETLYWATFMKEMLPLPGLFDFLAECRKSGTKVGVISDLTTRVQFEKILALGVADLLDFVTTSEEAGVEKPSKTIFALALRKMDLPAEAVVMIGDDLKRDVQGASGAGMRSIQIIHG